MAFSLKNNSEIKTYGSYRVVSNDVLCKEDIDALESVSVVQGEHGASLCFCYITGETQYVQIDSDCKATIGETVNPANVHILTLEKGGSRIFRARY